MKLTWVSELGVMVAIDFAVYTAVEARVVR